MPGVEKELFCPQCPPFRFGNPTHESDEERCVRLQQLIDTHEASDRHIDAPIRVDCPTRRMIIRLAPFERREINPERMTVLFCGYEVTTKGVYADHLV
mgnify:FL=1